MNTLDLSTSIIFYSFRFQYNEVQKTVLRLLERVSEGGGGGVALFNFMQSEVKAETRITETVPLGLDQENH